LTLLFPYLRNTDGVWALTVRDQSGEIVKTFDGSGRPPNNRSWEWTDDQGEPLDQGVYTYQFEWEGPGGTYQSDEETIAVRKTVRNVEIEVTGSPEALDKPADALELQIEK
jgi:flagellar hook assembly protein FlgD